MKVKGVVDRIVNNTAVVLIESNTHENKELTIDTEEYTLNESDVVSLSIKNDIVVDVEIDHEETKVRSENIQLKMRKLKQKGSKYKTK